MHWYGGSIAEAVTLSKQRNAIFVVFVEGDNDLSTEMATTIDDSAVVKRLSNETNFLAIKLKSGSPNYTHFAKIYQFVPVPSLFFIGRNGTPLEVVCAGVQPENLATRIDRILQEHHKEKQPSTQHVVQPSTSAQNVREQTASMLQAEAAASPAPDTKTTAAPAAKPPTSTAASAAANPPASAAAPIATPAAAAPTATPAATATVLAATVATRPHSAEPENSSGPPAKVQKTTYKEVTKFGKEYDVVCDGDVCVRTPKAQPGDPGPSGSGVSKQPEQQAPMATEESTASMEEKMERAKELIEARRREKADKEKELERQKELERREAGQGVAELKRWQADQELKQIQEERKREKMENNLARQRILEQIAQDRAERKARDTPAPVPQPSQTPPATSGDGSPRARIQFKLPDGTSHTAHFDADGTLGDVQRYVADNLQLSTSSFSLWTAFPRRELTETDATLRRLELAPSAALLVLPRRQQTTVASPSSFSALISFVTQFLTTILVTPAQQLAGWVRARLFPPPATGPATSPGPAPAPAPRRASPPPTGAAAALRRRGNIHRLPGDRSGDDDNNTWNGNSTQQM